MDHNFHPQKNFVHGIYMVVAITDVKILEIIIVFVVRPSEGWRQVFLHFLKMTQLGTLTSQSPIFAGRN